jgi:hypothetical protein
MAVTPTGDPPGRTVESMDNRTEVRDFLGSRRARLNRKQTGLIGVGARRVPGLRRAEVAQLAGPRPARRSTDRQPADER